MSKKVILLELQASIEQQTLSVYNHQLWVSIFAFTVSLIGLWVIIQQLIYQKNIARADFIFKLSQEAIRHRSAIVALEKLKSQRLVGPEREDVFKKNYENIRNYLRFCESIMLMLESKVISDAEIFSLLTYRILLATYCKEVQTAFLFTSRNIPQYGFCAIFALHDRLISYNKRRFDKELYVAMTGFGFGPATLQLQKREGYALGLEIYRKHKPLREGWMSSRLKSPRPPTS